MRGFISIYYKFQGGEENFVKSVCVFNIALKSPVTTLRTDPEAGENSFIFWLPRATQNTSFSFCFIILIRDHTNYSKCSSLHA